MELTGTAVKCTSSHERACYKNVIRINDNRIHQKRLRVKS